CERPGLEACLIEPVPDIQELTATQCDQAAELDAVRVRDVDRPVRYGVALLVVGGVLRDSRGLRERELIVGVVNALERAGRVGVGEARRPSEVLGPPVRTVL